MDFILVTALPADTKKYPETGKAIDSVTSQVKPIKLSFPTAIALAICSALRVTKPATATDAAQTMNVTPSALRKRYLSHRSTALSAASTFLTSFIFHLDNYPDFKTLKRWRNSAAQSLDLILKTQSTEVIQKIHGFTSA
jgi:hypothetical protein